MPFAAWSTVSVAVLLVSISVALSPVLAGPIHDAAKAGDAALLDRLIATGADADENDVARNTAPHLAADAGHIDVVGVLVANGADLIAKDISDLTPLQLAILGDHEAVANLLIAKGVDVNAMDNLSITVLDEATRKGNAGVIETLKQAGAKCGTSNYAC